MIEHLTFISYIIFFLFSTIGYGLIFSNIIYKDFNSYNIGWQGIIGFFSISLISILTSFFLAHNFFHNLTIHLIGITSFFIYYFKKKKFEELKWLFCIVLLLWVGTYVFKNHDDFPYYHLTYSLNLSENSFIVGTGSFSHGFRTFSSLFYFHSSLYMPFIKYYLFHIGPFFILLFFNLVILIKLFENFKLKKFDFIYFFSLLSFIFINIVFYRIGEHGTDRSAQILLVLIFLLFFEIYYFEKKNEAIFVKTCLLLVLVFLASSMKTIYYLYLILIPIILIKNKFFLIFFKKKNLLLITILSSSLFLNLITFYLNTGCFLYPAEKTCLIEREWSVPKKEVKLMSTHYEWWAKAGGGPNYQHEIKKEEYVKNFVWLQNWIERHFFNKVSDTLSGIAFICLFTYSLFWCYKKQKKPPKEKIDNISYIIIFLFLLEWFLNHPSMRYGGYILVALPIIVFTASNISKLILNKTKAFYLSIFFIFLTFVVYNGRNISRINKEINVYNYDLIKSPYFFVDEVISKEVASNKNLSIYQPQKNKMCWASKTPCSYGKNIKIEKYLWMNMVYRYD